MSISRDRDKPCVHCKKMHNAPDEECWTLAKNFAKKPQKRIRYEKELEKMFSAEQMNAVMQAVLQKQQKSNGKKSAQRALNYGSNLFQMDQNNNSKSENSYSPSEICESSKHTRKINNISNNRAWENTALNYMIKSTDKKTGHTVNQNSKSLTTELVAEVTNDLKETWPLRTLLDTGTTKSIVLRPFVFKRDLVDLGPNLTKWTTMGGEFVTNKCAKIQFKLPELSNSRIIEWICHVDERTTPEKANYDLILGLDLINELKMVLDFENKVIKWQDMFMEMNSKQIVTNSAIAHLIYQMTQESMVIKQAEHRQAQILDANYSKLDMEALVQELEHLTAEQKIQLQEVLHDHPILFGGCLGCIKIEPVHLAVKPDAKPYHAKPFVIPKAYMDTTRKEIQRFEELGIWKRVSSSSWTAGTFIQPKKTGDVRVLTDFRKLNEYLIRNPHPLPKISELLQTLEGFQWAMALDLSMGYYHIPLDEYSQGLCGTVVPWGVYQYTVLPMGISNAPDIFQSIMMHLFSDLLYV